MKLLNYFSLLLVFPLLNTSGADVWLKADKYFVLPDAFLCNTEVSFTCEIVPYPNTMTWQLNGAQIGECYKNNCFYYPPANKNYTFSSNTTTGVFELNIRNITVDDDRNKIVCENSQTADFIDIKVIVPQDEKQIENHSIPYGNNTRPSIKTGCLHPVDNVTVIWYSISSNRTGEKITEQVEIAPNKTLCWNNSECIIANKSAYITSMLMKNNLANKDYLSKRSVSEQDERIFMVEIKSYIWNKTYEVGTYIVQDGGVPHFCDETLCLTCWIFVIILLSITAATIVIVVCVNVRCLAEQQQRWAHWNTSTTVGSAILLVAHVAVTLVARFCRHADSCDDDKCLPCWAYCAILLVVIFTSILIIVFAKVCCGEKMVVRILVWEVLAIVVILLAAIAYVAVALIAQFCKVKAYSLGTNDISCDIYGIILACIFVIHVCVVLIVKGCCPKKCVVQTWEVIFIIGSIFFIVVASVFVILCGYRRKYTDNMKLAVSCWVIFLIVSGAALIFFLFVTLVYIFLEPLQEVKILSRKVNGKLMQVQVHLKCRLVKHKKFFVQLDINSHTNKATELSYEVVDKKSGLLQGTIAGLTLDSQYRAHVFTTMNNISSLEKTVEFDTKGRPLAPAIIREDEQLKTESSITINWKAATKEINQQYIIKYKRAKPLKEDWTCTSEIKKTQFTLDNLKAGTSYTIIVFAKNQIGLSEESKPLVVKTRAKTPEPPTDFQCKSVSQDEVTVSWKPSRKISKQKFRLSVSNTANDESSTCSEDEVWIPYDGSRIMEYTVKELKPETEYVFEVVTVVGKRASKRSAILFITTQASRHKPDLYQLVPGEKKTTSVFHLNR